jgi:hypothetical protein
MDMLLVIVGILLFMRFVGLAVLILADRDGGTARTASPRVDPCLGPVQGLPPGTGTKCRAEPGLAQSDEETILLGRLRSGKISREQYRAAMAELARRDSAAVRWPASPG